MFFGKCSQKKTFKFFAKKFRRFFFSRNFFFHTTFLIFYEFAKFRKLKIFKSPCHSIVFCRFWQKSTVGKFIEDVHPCYAPNNCRQVDEIQLSPTRDSKNHKNLLRNVLWCLKNIFFWGRFRHKSPKLDFSGVLLDFQRISFDFKGLL